MGNYDIQEKQMIDEMSYADLLEYCGIPDEDSHNFDRLSLLEMARSIQEIENE